MRDETRTFYGSLSQVFAGLEASRLRGSGFAIEGSFPDPPEVGQRFAFFGEPLTPETDVRVVLTSPVSFVEVSGRSDQGCWLFSTRSGSRYELTLGARPTVPV